MIRTTIDPSLLINESNEIMDSYINHNLFPQDHGCESQRTLSSRAQRCQKI